MSATDGPPSLLSSFSFRSKEHPAAGSGRRDLAGLTLDAVLGTETPKPKPPPQLYPSPSQITRTLLDIIRDEEPDSSSYKSLVDHQDRKAWRNFKDRLKSRGRAGNAWTPSIPTPSSDGPIRNFRNQNSRHNSSARLHPYSSDGNAMDGEEGVRRVQFRDFPSQNSRPVMVRRGSTRIGSGELGDSDDPPGPATLRPQFSRHNSTRLGSSRSESARFLNHCESSLAPKDELSMEAEERLARLAMAEERQMSAREAAAAQEAAEAAAAAAAAAEEEDRDNGSGSGSEGSDKDEEQPVRMSLMDLLEETDKQMGWEGSKYMVGDDEDEDYDEYDEDDDEAEDGSYECSCCVCMVKHKGQPLVPCGHAYCKLCTKEMYVSRGNCPLCNDFIQEILTVF
ncbi:LON peptidase N-terminal domain and RING finger protein 3-like [Punica granatum]|uniref:RING-type domain-containing protein n=2 Tax=Punica granatum TaxID=22663 RepID=A0A218XEX8_PUNGR|nr:LON peptidase N-terminal domain and RING finger protein 3-like [Punica granatum]OWM82892.1 hypothetical protein CDL15_Pgr005292 [Punica granatum]PKI64810.1 hypothetical protein CRG98_014806 [Punica granatum]